MPEGYEDVPPETSPAAGPEAVPDAFASALQRIEEAIRIQGEQVGNLFTHTQAMALDLAKLQAVRAVQQVPAAAADIVHAEGEAAQQLLEGAADVGASPAEVFVTKRRGFRKVREKVG